MYEISDTCRLRLYIFHTKYAQAYHLSVYKIKTISMKTGSHSTVKKIDLIIVVLIETDPKLFLTISSDYNISIVASGPNSGLICCNSSLLQCTVSPDTSYGLFLNLRATLIGIFKLVKRVNLHLSSQVAVEKAGCHVNVIVRH